MGNLEPPALEGLVQRARDAARRRRSSGVPYAAYGAGLAIEDGYFLAKALAGQDLRDLAKLSATLAQYETEREPYTYGVIKNAQNMGNLFHHAPLPVRKFRDFVFDHSRIPGEFIRKGYLKETEAQVRRV